MDCDAPWHGSFSVPAVYAPVSEPGGIAIVRKSDGSEWHPVPSDIAKLGVRIETSPTDSFSAVPLEKLVPTGVAGGRVYSRAVCQDLMCVFEAAFVPTIRDQQAANCGVFLARIDLYGQSIGGLAAAERAVRFQWSFGQDHGSLALDELTPNQTNTKSTDPTRPRQFSLDCKSNSPDAPLQEFDLDVNLDTNSYYGDVSGLDELGEVDEHKIVFRHHFRFEGVLGFREDEYSRDDGGLFWNRSVMIDGKQQKPGATCKVEPPRQGFKATASYQKPGSN